MSNIVKIIFILIVLLSAVFVAAEAPVQEKIVWGVNFSQMQAGALGLDWKETYRSILDNLGVKNIKLMTQWNFVENRRDKLYFTDIDWQLQEAKRYGAKVIYVIGMKTGRWPECHLPQWAKDLSKERQQEEILDYIKEAVARYRSSDVIVSWQAENEPLFVFGQCPWYDKEFLKKEVALIKSIDPSRPVVISDSGEQSLWIQAADIGDVVGVTIYRKAWVHISDKLGFYFNFPISPKIYWFKSELIRKLFGKKVINVELQAEPWNSRLFYDVPIEEQEKSMNLTQFNKNVKYAKETGLNEFYFWGAEWWHWLKKVHNKPEIWNESKKLFLQ